MMEQHLIYSDFVGYVCMNIRGFMYIRGGMLLDSFIFTKVILVSKKIENYLRIC